VHALEVQRSQVQILPPLQSSKGPHSLDCEGLSHARDPCGVAPATLHGLLAPAADEVLGATYELAWQQDRDGPFPIETIYPWSDDPGGTEMRLRNRGTPSGFARVAAPVMRRAMRAAMTKDLARLADRLGRD
jgi:hypothetical protein